MESLPFQIGFVFGPYLALILREVCSELFINKNRFTSCIPLCWYECVTDTIVNL